MSNDSNSIGPSNRPSSGVDDTAWEDPYAGLDDYAGGDWGLDESGDSGDIFFTEDPGGFGDSSSGPSDMSLSGLRNWLNDLKGQDKITESRFDKWMGKVNHSAALSPNDQSQALDEVVSAVNAHLAPPNSGRSGRRSGRPLWHRCGLC